MGWLVIRLGVTLNWLFLTDRGKLGKELKV
jgi:hypothetical protein